MLVSIQLCTLNILQLFEESGSSILQMSENLAFEENLDLNINRTSYQSNLSYFSQDKQEILNDLFKDKLIYLNVSIFLVFCFLIFSKKTYKLWLLIWNFSPSINTFAGCN